MINLPPDAIDILAEYFQLLAEIEASLKDDVK